MSNIPITPGSGAASVATETVGGLNFQQVEIYGGGGASILGINPDRSINASIIGIPNVVIAGGSITTTAQQGASVSGTVGASIIGTVPTTQSGIQYASVLIASVVGAIPVTGTLTFQGGSSVITASVMTTVGYVSTANSISSQMSTNSVFTGPWEEVKDFSAIYVTVNSDKASATNGLSLQRSTNASSVITSNEYTIAAQTGRTFQIQPDARYFRVVYTNSAANQGAMALQTVYKQGYSKPSSQRPGDAYTNETDLEQMQAFNMVYNGTTWDRARGNATNGTLVFGSIQAAQTGTQITSISGGISSVALVGANTVSVVGTVTIGSIATVGAVIGSVAVLQGTNPWVVNAQNSSILAVPVGSVITVLQSPSIVGTYAEDAASATGDKGFFVLGVRNDTLASITSADADYTAMVQGPAGETVVANSPFTKWVQGTADIRGAGTTGGSVTVIAAQGASIFTYITGVQVVNLGSASVLVTFSGATSSIVGYTIAPAGGGSNIVYRNALKTNANGAFTASISGIASVLVSAQGFISKT